MLTSSNLVLAHGCFDVLHSGHIEHLLQAKAMGGYLVVSITADKYISKGPGRPVFSQEQRVDQLWALRMVDEVYVCHDPTALPAIEKYRPKVYVKGPDYEGRRDGRLAREKARVEELGGELRFTTGKLFSSSHFINANLSAEVRDFLAEVRGHDVLGWLDRALPLHAHVVGEAIEDVYVYMSPKGQARKEGIISYRKVREERWDGGSRVVAGHVDALCDTVTLSTCSNSPVVKTRYVSDHFAIKLFSSVDEEPFRASRWQPKLEPMKNADFVLVADFGHGAINTETASYIAGGIPYLALTVQTNASNYGFNLLTKWPRADYVAVDEEELRLACQDGDGDLLTLATKQKVNFRARVFVITLGHRGCLVLDDSGVTTAPALAEKVVDRMGTGDAFLGTTAPLAYLGAPRQVIAFVGSVAAAIEAGKVGNVPTDRAELRRWCQSLCK
jgi:rfaE bifunctional protein nucleotidyltransferase chain/domain